MFETKEGKIEKKKKRRSNSFTAKVLEIEPESESESEKKTIYILGFRGSTPVLVGNTLTHSLTHSSLLLLAR